MWDCLKAHNPLLNCPKLDCILSPTAPIILINLAIVYTYHGQELNYTPIIFVVQALWIRAANHICKWHSG